MHELSFLGFELCLEHGLSILDLFVVDLISLFKQEISEIINGVLRDLLAELNEALSEEWDKIIHEVLPDGLRPSVKEISLLLFDELGFGHVLELLGPLLLDLFVFFGLLLSLFFGPLAVIFLFVAHNERQLIVVLFFLAFIDGLFCRGLLGLAEVLEELVVLVGDEVETAGLAVLLDEVLELTEDLRLRGSPEGADQLEVLGDRNLPVKRRETTSEQILYTLT